MRIYEQTTRYELYSINELQDEAYRAAIDNIVIGIVEDIESYCMKRGYDYFYKIDDDEVLDYIRGNDVEFLEDGTIF